MSDEGWQEWFARAWAFREEELYPKLFGDVGSGIYPLGGELFTDYTSRLSYRMQGRIPPLMRLDHLGSEASSFFSVQPQAHWAIVRLQRIVAVQIVLAADRFPGKVMLNYGDRIPLRRPIDGGNWLLTAILIAPFCRFCGTATNSNRTL